MDEQDFIRQVQDDLTLQTRQAIARLIELCPLEFGLESLIPADPQLLPTVPEKLAQLYQEVNDYCKRNSLAFDHVWVCIINLFFLLADC